MTHTQESLTAFDDVQTAQPESPESEGSPKETAGEPVEVDTSTTEFSSPEPFPADGIENLSSGEITLNLCTPDAIVSPTFRTVAGRGGMGTNKSIENAEAVADIATACIGLPLLLTGGGMNTPMGSGAILGRLLDVKQPEDSVKIELQELYQRRGIASEDVRTVRLGSYQLSLPSSISDCQDAIKSLAAWENDEMDYLNAAKRQKHELTQEQLKTFESLSPADKVQTPEYATQLEVVSEPFETHAVIPRGTLSNKTVEVLAVAVNNPKGGYYQLGIEQPSAAAMGDEIPTCHLSHSQQSPPTPNTAFTRDSKFSSTDLDIVPIEHPPDPEVVPPDQEVLESPLPEPRMRTAVDNLDGVGDSTAMKLHKATDNRVSAESIAHTMFGDGEGHTDSISEIESILNSLPRKDQIYNQLKTYTPNE